MEPLVSIIVPVFNAEKFIFEALSSLKEQTYRNLEVIVVNDGSTDKSEQAIHSAIGDDRRFVYVARENRGLVATLNQMILMSNGAFIARMDADDVATPDRVARQIEYFMAHPQVAIVGSRTEIIDEKGVRLGFCKRPLSEMDVKAYFLYGSPLAHPTVMFNLNVLRKDELSYDADAYPVEDLELWLRLARKYKIANLGLPLLKYRITSSGISQTNKQRQVEKSASLRTAFFADYPELLRLIGSIEDGSGNVFINACRRLEFTIKAASSRGPFSLGSLMKLWARTVVRDVRIAK